MSLFAVTGFLQTYLLVDDAILQPSAAEKLPLGISQPFPERPADTSGK
ncbi:MAG: hypothetical protein KME08_08555 [Aphanothece sp. CMT-3BRIN-NPC111]|jgi:hypothetical protein|nr:hypothetical protein [Aphanothece sp. CMT-3BRIN-NPC111]